LRKRKNELKLLASLPVATCQCPVRCPVVGAK
jgi:hypothetical protein